MYIAYFWRHSPAVTIVFSAEPLLSVRNHCFLSKGVVTRPALGVMVLFMEFEMDVTAFNINNWNVGVEDNFGRHGLGNL